MTVLAQLNLNESAQMDFGIEVLGTENKSMDIRFIIEGPDYGIVCKCTESAGVITASVPKLNGILPSGTYSATLEVVIDGKHFRPLTENIQFNAPVTVGVVGGVKVKPQNNIQMQAVDVRVRVSEEEVSVKPVALKQLDKQEVRGSSFANYVKPGISEAADYDDEAKIAKMLEIQQKVRSLTEKIARAKKPRT